MHHLKLSLFGSPQIILNGVPIKNATHKAIPFFAYLAFNNGAQTREAMARLLWSDCSLPNALASLRTTLWRLKSAGLADWISLENNQIALNSQKNFEADTLDFEQKLRRCMNHGHAPSQVCLLCLPALSDAVELYKGEFMSGVTLPKAQVFNEWRMQQGDILNSLFLDALGRLIKGYRNFGDFSQAILYARTLLRHDRYNDTAQYDLLQLYLITGQRIAAINQYKHYKELISRELGIEPPEQITTLYKQILRGQVIPPPTQKVKAPIFMIADIEGTNQAGAQAGTNKDSFLKTYHSIFTLTARQFGGHILQKSEDNITLLFENGQPLHCAVTIHLKVMKTDWGVIGPPNIRMVLYSTAPGESTNHNFPMITRAASNLLLIGWGGQILFSEHTMKDLDQPSGSRYKDLGYHTLKDITDPIHVFELVHPHLPAIEHPPLRSVGPLVVNFPSFTPAFLGRVEEMKQLAEVINEPNTRLITLVGSGGVGKTRLAAQFAAQNANQFSDGVYFINLAPIQDPGQIPIILADAVKFSFYGPRDHTEQLCDYLHHMHALLIIDNFEYLRQEGTKFLVDLLRKTHDLKVIVTSRERLYLFSETIFEVHGLPVPAQEIHENAESFSSIRLFFQNAQRIIPRFSLDKNINEIIQICRLLNGLPLGIILAASLVRVYSCAQIADEIEKNIDFLTLTAPDIAPRHRSLRAVFDSSMELLSEHERLILCRLSIFRSSFTTQAADEICSASPEILASFQDKSLLYSLDNRYALLETFRHYLFDKLTTKQDEYWAVKNNYVEYYADFCYRKNQEINSSFQRQALDEMVLEFENIRIAWNWFIETDRWELLERVKHPILAFHIMTGNFIGGREFFHYAASKLDSLADPELKLTRSSMHQFEAWLAIKIGFVNEGLQGLLECLETFRSNKSPWDEIMTLMFLGDTYRLLGNFLLGEKMIEDALGLIQGIDIPKSNYIVAITANCRTILGTIQLEMGEYDLAQVQFQASLEIHRKIGTYYGSISALQGLGKIAYFQGEFSKARDLYLQALETATQIYEQHGMARIHNNLSNVYESLASPTQAYHHLLTALSLIKETGDRRLTAIMLSNLAYHQLKYLQNPSEAIRTYHESIEIFSSLANLRGVSYSYYDISNAYLQVGLVNEALVYCTKSLSTAMTLDDISLILHTLHGFVVLYANTNRQEQALRLCYLIENHQQITSDTQKRVIVSRSELEPGFTADIIQAARVWGENTSLKDGIELVMVERISS